MPASSTTPGREPGVHTRTRSRSRSRGRASQQPAPVGEQETATVQRINEHQTDDIHRTPSPDLTESRADDISKTLHSKSNTATSQAPAVNEDPTPIFPLPLSSLPADPTTPASGISALRRSQQAFEALCSTPIRKDSHASTGKIESQKKAVFDELGSIPEVGEGFLDDLYMTEELDDSIAEFLEQSPLYDSKAKRWAKIPRSVNNEKKLYKPYRKIIKAILKGPGKGDDGCTTTRKVVDTHSSWIKHYDEVTATKPDIAIVATGPSFEEPIPKSSKERNPGEVHVGFCNIASVFDIKKDNGRDKEIEQIKQLAVYCRQLFLNQPNRCFSVHSTRSLSVFTATPSTFVRLVVGLSSHNEADLGLDTSVQWTIVDGRKSEGTISTLDANGERVDYKLIMDAYSTFTHHTIRGRGTMHWYAREDSEDGSIFLIKDSWRSDGRTPEDELLALASDIPGIAEKVAFEDDLAQTKDYRPDDFEDEDFTNCTLARVTLKYSGPSLAHFSTQVEAMEALRDCDQSLLTNRILHRDITIDNIMIVKGEGSLRGFIFDLDMALVAKAKISSTGRTGLRLFMSVALLRDAKKRRLSPAVHDYLDDLEAFFYVVNKLLYGFSGPGAPVPRSSDVTTSILARWEIPSDDDISAHKYNCFAEVDYFEAFPLYWSTACLDLEDKFRKYLRTVVMEKQSIRKEKNSVKRTEGFRLLYDGIDSHYSTIIGFFDEAVTALKKPGGSLPRREGSTSPTPSRGSDGSGDDATTSSPLPSNATPPNPFNNRRRPKNKTRPQAGLQANYHITGPNTPDYPERLRVGGNDREGSVPPPPTPSARIRGYVPASIENFDLSTLGPPMKRALSHVTDVEHPAAKRSCKHHVSGRETLETHAEEENDDEAEEDEQAMGGSGSGNQV
ncbi:hypothetical protein DFP72DRAFT_1092123 [Ephemerocybe angulata]|uniref:Fungal-type protein kinase domain-containing protein n=1 Tax=Ephemerocybe angulata TaxID=980116 RepID=A0A8H6I8D1_9AGAR|nr:hypothetical protein DFP72DRAFT_1092123 [Tulosesus angulatus]